MQARQTEHLRWMVGIAAVALCLFHGVPLALGSNSEAPDGSFLLEVETGDGGSVFDLPDGDHATGFYPAGATVRLIAVPAAGHRFAGWGGDVPAAVRRDNPLVLVMDYQARKVSARFAQRTPPRRDGLVLHYTFDADTPDRVADESGRECDGIPHGPTPCEDRFGRANKACSFDGYLDYISLHSPALSRFTICGWLKPEGQRDGAARFFNSGWEQTFDVGIGGTNSTVWYRANPEVSGWQDTACAVPEGQWSFVALTSDGTSFDLYVNGAVRANIARAVALEVMKLGAHTSDPARDSFKGSMDDVRIYDRPLPAEELDALFAGTSGNVPAPAAPESPPPVLPASLQPAVAEVPPQVTAGVEPAGQTEEATASFAGSSGDVGAAAAPDSLPQLTPDSLPPVTAEVPSQVTARSEAAARAAADGLVAFYPFDGDARDASGNGNDGTVRGALMCSDRFGRTNAAYQFEGGAHIEMRSPLPDMTNMSFSVWIVPARIDDEPRSVFFEGDMNYRRDLTVWVKNDEGWPAAWATKDGNDMALGRARLTPNAWMHLAGVYDAAQGVKELWINGERVAAERVAGAACVGNHFALQVGRSYDGSWACDFFDGSIDDLRIYNRPLQEEEIAAQCVDAPAKPKPVALAITGTPEPYGLCAPFGYGTNLVMPGTAVTNSVRSPVDVEAGTRMVCAGWTGGGDVPAEGAGAQASFTIRTRSILTWQWRREHRLECAVCLTKMATDSSMPAMQRVDSALQPVEYGSVDVTGGWYGEGSNVTVIALASNGFRFVGWMGDVDAQTATGLSVSVAMDRYRTVVAAFAPLPSELPITLTVNGAPASYGQSAPLDYGTHSLPAGTVVTNAVASLLAAAEGIRHVCVGWTGLGDVPASGSETSVVFTLTGDSTLTWHWKKQYWLKTGTVEGRRVGKAGGGSVDVVPAWFDAGETVTLTGAPARRCRFVRWAGDVPEAQAFANPLVLVMDRPRAATAIFVRDSDADGMSDDDEAVAGTSAVNASDVLVICGIRTPEGGGAGVELRWPTVAGRRYRVMNSRSLLEPFLPAATNIPGTGGVASYVDRSAAGAECRMYRVEVEN